LVPVRDVDALVEAMERFINHPGLIEKMGNESRKFVEKKFDVRVVNENLLKAMGLY
jgi:glycosyltransferase involved in cell wall biosynthesis